ncbi:MAG TPA: zinc-binding dehydrogenase [Solirubrobacterales bacterium]|nr:zinc-binding dehydrogenase [Solirubrobacterales bacterium]
MKAIQLQEFGGADAFEYVELDDPTPGEGEVLVEVARCGVNFADTHSTRNDYLAEQQLPLVPGAEIAGRTGDGTRVVALVGTGGYAEKVLVPESSLIPVPDGVGDDEAAGALLQGLTAMALVKRSARIEAGETIVIEAAAGGTGTLAVQIAKAAGAKVIGLASSAEKRELVEGLGADATVDSQSDDLRAALLEANDGQKVDAVLHMSGGASFDAELAALAPLGRLVVFGNASREARQVDTGALLQGSKAVIGFWLVHVLARRDLAVPMIGELLGALATGALRVTIGGVYPLSEAARAHEALESRSSAGKLLLDPTS